MAISGKAIMKPMIGPHGAPPELKVMLLERAPSIARR